MKNILLLSLFISVSFSCSNKIKNIHVDYDPEADLNYGTILPVKIYSVLNEKKNKTVVLNKYQLDHYFKFKAEGAKWYFNTDGPALNSSLIPLNNYSKYCNAFLQIEKYPLSAEADSFSAEISSIEYNFNKKINLHLNYKGPLYIDFGGKNGEKGGTGLGKNWLLSILTKDGATGGNGETGGNGTNGDSILVKIIKVRNQADSIDFTCVFVINKKTMEEFVYKTYFPENGIIINTSGGDGGDGGDGNEGGNGGNGGKKVPGDGGNGGNGGDGGIGGDAGDAEIVIHPNAKELIPLISIYNDGGKAGRAGKGGSGGTGGSPAENQQAGTNGTDGSDGTSGMSGKSGDVHQPRIETF